MAEPSDSLTREDIAEIAGLARLALSDDEIETLRAELGAILGAMTALAKLDTTGVEPMTHAVPADLRLRADEIGESFAQEVAVGSAPDARDGSFRVPRVIDAATSDRREGAASRGSRGDS